MPDAPDQYVLAATLTAWSEWVPLPKLNSNIISLPDFRLLMKKLAELLTLFIAHMPISVIPIRYSVTISQSVKVMPSIMVFSGIYIVFYLPSHPPSTISSVPLT